MKYSAGLVIILDNNKILLQHPTNNNQTQSYSIPKGGLNEGEEPLDAAIRETFEECGLLFDKDDIEPTQYTIEYKKKNSNIIYKIIYYYIIRIEGNKINKYNIPSILSKDKLQLEEVDWAGFLSFRDASNRIFPKQLQVLTHINKK